MEKKHYIEPSSTSMFWNKPYTIDSTELLRIKAHERDQILTNAEENELV